MEHPRKRYLGVGRIFLHGEPMQQIEYRPVGLDILFRQLGNEFPHVIEPNCSCAVTLPERNPLAIGENGTTPIPFSRHTGKISVSQSRSTIE